LEYYIHQIGSIKEKSTYERLISILKNKVIASRDYMEKSGIEFIDYNLPFQLDISNEKETMYYTDDIHKDRVSLSDPENKFIKVAINVQDHRFITCFDYDYIAFAVSRDVSIVPEQETKGLAFGEVQVKDKIDSDYIMGLILPFSKQQLLDERCVEIIEKVADICNQNNFPLDIYNYDGDLLKGKKTTIRNKK